MKIRVKFGPDDMPKAAVIKADIDEDTGTAFIKCKGVDKEKYPETAKYLERKSTEIVEAIRLYIHLLEHPDHVADFAFEAKPEEVPKMVREFLASVFGDSEDDSKDKGKDKD